MVSELSKMKRGTEEYATAEKQVQKVIAERKSAQKQLRADTDKSGIATQSFAQKAGASFMKYAGYAAAAWAVVKSGEWILKSLGSTSDWLEATLAGVKNAIQFIGKALASLNFKNFFGGLKETFEVGKQAAEVLDDLEDKQRSLKIAEADAIKFTLERNKILRDATKTDKERIKASDEIIAKEDELANKRSEITGKMYQNEIDRIAKLNNVQSQELENYIRNYDQLDKNSELHKKFSKVTDEEKDKVIGLYEGWKNAESSALENTMKVSQRRSSLLENTSNENNKALEEQQKVIEEQQKYIDEIIRSGQTLLENENYQYNERLKNAGLFNIGQKTLTEEQLQALVILQNEHVANVNGILEKQSEDDKRRNEAAYNEAYFLLQESNVKELNALKNRCISEQMTDDQYNSIKNTKLLAQLQAEYELRKQFGLSTLDIEGKINDLILQNNTELSEKNKELKLKEYEELKKDCETKLNLAMDFGKSIGAAVGEAVENQEDIGEAAMKAMILGALDALKTYSELMVVQATIGSLASPSSIATFGVAGLAKAAILTGMIEAAFALAKAGVNRAMAKPAKQYSTGGYTGPGNTLEPAGIVHKGEYVIPQWQMKDKYTMQFLPLIESIRTKKQVFFEGGFTSNIKPLPSQNILSSDAELKKLMAMNAQLLQILLNEGVNANIGDKQIEAITKRQKVHSDIIRSANRYY